MSKTLQTLSTLSAAKRMAGKAKSFAGRAKRAGKAAATKAGDVTTAAARSRPGQATTGLIDRAAGTKSGVRRASVYGGIPFVPAAHLGAKRGTRGAATTASIAGAKVGFGVGGAVGGPAGALVGSMAGGAVGAGASQTEAGRKAIKAVDRRYTKAKKSIGKSVKNKVEDTKAGVRSAVGASVASDVSQAFGGKKVSRLKAFRRGYKANKMVREISEDLNTLRSLSRRGRIKPSK